ncbi:serine/threonine-protein phosphatase [Streptomyces sp. RPA4-5]|uniref:PP2C family protein-serine/threonine phosphatase n=1 Tax=unclassified Streptomyces TaxID=2593676 RepID=UPI00143EC1EC|nr:MULTISPECIES: PP2C family protein-serine/threonine phosphatase [unclassified Streptomyces]QIY53740.1 serine/threonine-protein phosphatase [Streptomyces sp. RPA4-5]WJY36285.1 PP2C family protein-serine/threonine phosphatase [Streptomyces sp. P9-2B-2]
MTQRREVERALRASAPHALVDTLRDVLAERYGALSVELLLADHGATVLTPFGAAGAAAAPVPVANSAEGRAFDGRQPHQQTRHADIVEHHLPVTVRGERTGLLTVRLPAERSVPDAVHDLVHAAALLGHELLVAERDTDVYQRARRIGRFTLAAEMQWHLLPGRACAADEYAIGAQLEPAHDTHGDNYDWASDADELTLAVTDGMGTGVHASLLTHLAVNALRNARRAGIRIEDQAALADQALYAQHRGAAHVSTLLLRFDIATGRVQAVDAGSPQLWRMRGRAIERIELDPQMPLGMFEETHYKAQEFEVLSGDRLVVVSDGVYAARSPQGETYAERALARAIHAGGLLPAAAVPRAVLRDLADFRAAEPLDDLLVLCVDWFGKPGDRRSRPTSAGDGPR